ncbi:putative bifunctional diguanylate cyclase/phosphodiesterase [Rhodoferax sp.]|uniref:putative bifunctional diguanylate cyclase/phosphodiesterase n=1 Tax=Rhodoferax sp. TaxID=50421 RepID=UPI00374CE3A5
MEFIRSSPSAPWLLLFLATGLAALVLYLLWRWQRTATRLAEVSHELAQAYARDGLTGLLTPRQFERELDHAVLHGDFEGHAVCVLYADVDHFRSANEAFGKQAGDQVLQELAKRIQTRLGTGAIAARMVGNEFAVVVRGGLEAGRHAAALVAAACAEPIQVQSKTKSQVQSLILTCSIGLAMYPEQAERRNLVERAAMAMRSVKLAGGDGFAEYDPLLAQARRESASLMHDLRGALERQELQLYYQPKIDARSLQVTSAEALIRWRHPKRGLVGPDKFIPLAERYGMMQSIGRWVIEQACQQAQAWREQGLSMRIAVNISGQQLRRDDFAEHLHSVLLQTGTPAARFTCEITESVALENTAATMQTFEKLRTMGVHVSIDDFGTGHSSLATLRKLPAAELKIDRAFVIDLDTSEHAQFIANSVVRMAHALDMRVVAEGVETRTQRDLLVAMGCDELQGYLFAKPMRAQELGIWAAREHEKAEALFRPSLYFESGPG